MKLFLKGLLFLVFLTVFSCVKKENHLKKKVTEFYNVYNKRKDINRFLSFYDKNVLLEDIINGNRVQGIEELKTFFDWNNTNLVLNDKKSIIINNIVIEDSLAVISGYFAEFSWNKKPFEAMHITTILTFDKKGKITHHVDWINYPNSLVNYQTRKNSNKWLQ